MGREKEMRGKDWRGFDDEISYEPTVRKCSGCYSCNEPCGREELATQFDTETLKNYT